MKSSEDRFADSISLWLKGVGGSSSRRVGFVEKVEEATELTTECERAAGACIKRGRVCMGSRGLHQEGGRVA